MSCAQLLLMCLVALASAQGGGRRSRPSSTTVSTPDSDCGVTCESEVDLVMILDDSNSIADWQFDIMKDFVADVIANDVVISASDGQVGIVQFDDDSRVVCDLQDSERDVQDCLDDTVYTDGGLTNIEAAIIDAMNIRNQRSGVQKTMVLMTDGDPTAGGDPVPAAEEAKAEGWEIFTIGIGSVSVDMLRRIATDDDHVIMVEQFEDLDELNFSTCKEISCPTPEDPCGEECQSIIDVVFVLDDSNSIADFEFDMSKEFVAAVCQDLGVGANAANIGIVQFDDNAETICDIEGSKGAVESCLDDTQYDDGGLTNIAEALEVAKGISGGRSGVPKVIVLMTDGEPTAGGDPVPVADMAKDEGWEIVAVGIGSADLDFLEDLATSADHVYRAENFEDLLNTVLSEFEICVPGGGGGGGGSEQCESVVDIVVILDDSNSIAEWQFDIAKEFVSNLIENDVELSPSQGQVGLVQFDDDSRVVCDLEDSDSAVEDCLGNTQYTDGGLTNIEAALVDATNIRNRRGGVRSVMVLITDGDPTAGGDPIPAAAAAKRDGWEVYCIGIGNVSEDMLNQIATDSDHVFLVDTFEDLEGLGFSTCEVVEDPCEPVCDPTEVCESKIDVCFILDESNSIADFEFDQTKEFVRTIAQELGVGPNDANVGLVTFDDDAQTICDIESSASAVDGCIDDATYQQGGLTNIQDAIETCADIGGRRNGVPDVMVIMTDGDPTAGDDPLEENAIKAAEDAKADGWNIFAIGIGQVSRDLLESIASDTDQVFMAENFEQLEGLLEEFEICVPSDAGCEEEEEEEEVGICGKADIVWVTDHSSSIAEWEFDLLKEFQKTIVESTDVGSDGTQYGQVGFSDDSFKNFDLNDCSNAGCVTSEIDDIDFQAGSTNLAAGLREARDINGVRSGVQKIFFVSTDGVPNREEDETEPQARAAQSEGWNLICLGIGNADKGFLEDLCDTVYIVDNFEDLEVLVEEIACS